MFEGGEGKRLKHRGSLCYFVTQSARRVFVAVAVSLVICCMLNYYMYHVVLYLSLLEENKL